MPEAELSEVTYIGQVRSVRGGVVQVELRDVPTTLVMVEGAAHRIGQIGAFVRIPLGYTQLYGVCTQVGADMTTPGADDDPPFVLEADPSVRLRGYRWMTVALFGEAVEGKFDRGVGQYPTVGDGVHLVTARDLDVIYSQRDGHIADGVVIGRVAESDALPAALRLSALVNRHACVVGSTGSGKSNLVAVLLRALAAGPYLSARVLVVDPHGEYASALPAKKTQRITAGASAGTNRLRVPYWALPFDELVRIAMGSIGDREAEFIRERVRDLKVEAARHLPNPPNEPAITADSPIPFSIRRLWWELQDNERKTFKDRAGEDPCERTAEGDSEGLEAPEYPSASLGSAAPFLNPGRRGLGRQLDFMRSRLLDSRFTFMFDTSDEFHPDQGGVTRKDLDSLLADWIGGEAPLTVIDVSALPADVLAIVVGTMISLVYDALFWGVNLPVGGKQQPLLLVIDEAHRFLPRDAESPAARACARIAKEGRKYGVGVLVVTQRPSDVDPGVLSQCGTMIALRVTNGADRTAVASTVPDDLGGLTALLPSLRTGEGLVLGDALQVPSRVRIYKAPERPVGDDPVLPDAWLAPRPDSSAYATAVAGWRNQTTAPLAQPERSESVQPATEKDVANKEPDDPPRRSPER